MPIVASVDKAKQLTIFTVTGELSFGEVKKVLRSFYEEHPTRDLLWDFRNASMKLLSYDNLDTFANYVERHGIARAGGKTAFVVSGDLEYGLSRMIKSFTEIRDIPINLMGFRSMEEAVQWLSKKE